MVEVVQPREFQIVFSNIGNFIGVFAKRRTLVLFLDDLQYRPGFAVPTYLSRKAGTANRGAQDSEVVEELPGRLHRARA